MKQPETDGWRVANLDAPPDKLAFFLAPKPAIGLKPLSICALHDLENKFSIRDRTNYFFLLKTDLKSPAARIRVSGSKTCAQPPNIGG